MEKPFPVVLFRAAKQPEDSYDLALKEAGYTPHFIPVLKFHHTNQDVLRASLLDSSKYSGLVVTSQTAVEAVSAALAGSEVTAGLPEVTHRSQLVEQWKGKPVFVVGKATAQAVNTLGLDTFGSYSGNAEILSQVIIKYFTPLDQQGPLLFPCSNLRRETLPSTLGQAGLALETLESYRTEPHPDIEGNIQRLVEELAPEAAVLCVVFFSPSGVNYALDKLVDATRNRISLKLVAIGPTSAEALTKAGHPPSATATKPTPDSLLEAISILSQ